jgi:hypothetical protein
MRWPRNGFNWSPAAGSACQGSIQRQAVVQHWVLHAFNLHQQKITLPNSNRVV